MNINSQTVICIGSILWDVVGRTNRHLQISSDMPGRIQVIAGGVAMNIAMTLVKFSLQPILLSSLGSDEQGQSLLQKAKKMGINTNYIYISKDLPTDFYMAIEGSNGLIAAIADSHSLENAGSNIIKPLRDGRLGSKENPFAGVIVIDGNLTVDLLQKISLDPLFALADIRCAPASIGKAERILPLLEGHLNVTVYVNLSEANLICKAKFGSSKDAAIAMVKRGASRTVVTNSAEEVSYYDGKRIFSATPPEVMAARVTGAGDTFVAAHIAAEKRGESAQESLDTAVRTAANYVAGDDA